jgi:DNA polymerase
MSDFGVLKQDWLAAHDMKQLPKLDENRKYSKIYLDFETRSLADLKVVGAAKYAADPSTDVLCVAHTGLESIRVLKSDFFPWGSKYGHFLEEAADDSKTIFISHGIFDQFIWKEVMVKKYGYPEIPIERWRCTMSKCYAHGLSGSLKEAAIALNLPIKKDMEGRDNMLSLSKPRKTKSMIHNTTNGATFWTPQDKPEAFEKLYEYCKTDVEVMRLIDETLLDLTQKEQKIWFIDQRINHEGIKVDIEAIKTAIKVGAVCDDQKQSTLKGITGGMPDNSRRRALLLAWLNKQGLQLTDTKRSTLEKCLSNESDLTDEVKIVLQTCISGGKTSLAKYSKMLERADENGIIREILQYHGAHTGRWAGRGIQIQNFPRETFNSNTVLETLLQGDDELFSLYYRDAAGALSSMLRKVIKAPNESTFYGADFSQIEARVLAWLAGQKSVLEAYERGEDLYCKAASDIFGRTITKEDKNERQIGKVATLALGYGGGIGAFATMAGAYNVNLSEVYPSIWPKTNPWERQQASLSFQRYQSTANQTLGKEAGYAADIIKQRWRNANKQIVDYWQRVEEAARMAIRNQGLSVKGLYTVTQLRTGTKFLQCKLPSGRVFSYLNPSTSGNTISYDAPKYGKSSTYGGELVENIVQAVSRDVMAEAMVRLEERFPTVFTVHDEVVSLALQPNNNKSFQEFERIMLQVPVWAKGLPIDVECWSGSRYGK